MTFGSFGGGILMNNGRRKTIMLSLYIGLLGNIVTIYLNFYMLLIGRFMFGVSTGIFSSTIIRFINETVPFHVADSLSVGYVFISTTGSIIAFSLGSVLPADD
jgi:predicted MFS family arabinose efflux permease